MKIARVPHRWTVSPREAVRIQLRLRNLVRTERPPSGIRLVAGADLAFTNEGRTCVAGIIVWDLRAGALVERVVVRKAVSFPYVPGLLSFREAPAILAALRKLRCEPDIVMLDGQGLAHPRRFGLACHVGVIIDRPTVGCAKSLLVGAHQEVGLVRGSCRPLQIGSEIVGMAVRTREAVKPVYVSVGHRVTLDAAVKVVLDCGTRYRLPEPTRLADQLVSCVSRNPPAGRQHA